LLLLLLMLMLLLMLTQDVLKPGADAQLPPERPKAAEGTQSATALWAVNCGASLNEAAARQG
jgi:hypothetical protein